MLDDLHGQNDIEAFPGRRQRLGGYLAIVDIQLALLGVATRRSAHGHPRPHSIPVTRAPRRVSGSAMSPPPQPMSSRRKPGERRGDPGPRGRNEATSRSRARKRADRVQPVQRPELAGRVPPSLRHGGELGDFRGVDAIASLGAVAAHRDEIRRHVGRRRRAHQGVARRVKREVDAGNEVAVVVSAMAGATNQLVGWTRQASRCTTRANTMSSSRPASR